MQKSIPWPALLVLITSLGFAIQMPSLADELDDVAVEADELGVFDNFDDTPLASSQARRFVATGYLDQLRRTRGGSRRYVLLGQSGKPTAYVQPSADVYLRPYLGQNIGVTAKEFKYRQGQPPSIVVRSVTVLPVKKGSGLKNGPGSIAQSSFRPMPATEEPGPFLRPDPFLKRADYQQTVHPTVLEDLESGIGIGNTHHPVVGPALPSPGQAPPSGCSVCGGCGAGGCGVAGWLWVRPEYLIWWADGMDVPPLVTSSPPGTPRADVGVLGRDTTDIRYGNGEILDSSRSGFRIQFGGWIDPARMWGIEGEYLGLSDESEVFSATSDNGDPLLARPFFNINPTDPTTGVPNPPAREDAELIGFPDTVEGTVDVRSSSSLDSAGARLLLNLCCNAYADGGPNQFSRVDLLLGYRYMQLKERLIITEDLSALDPANPLDFDIVDGFDTQNTFHGAELGTVWQTAWYRWTLELLAKVALGNVHQVVTVNGSTEFDPPVGPSTTMPGGLLAQRTNIGKHSRDDFAMVPELGATLGYFLTPRLRATVGYTFLYFSQVARPGDQIDLDVNPDLLPPEADPFTGPLRPRLVFRDTDFWAQGLNLGLDYRW